MTTVTKTPDEHVRRLKMSFRLDRRHQAEHEDIEQVELSLPELWMALQEGKIVDAKTLIAVQWLLSASL